MMKKVSNDDLKQMVLDAQDAWSEAIVELGRLYVGGHNGQYRDYAQQVAETAYAYLEEGEAVLFKPTKAAQRQFRPTIEGAVSYFVGQNKDFPEDQGFALKPWRKVEFHNTEFILSDPLAIVMGNYFFTAEDGSFAKVEYTFGYKRFGESLKIVLHHSSLPYEGA